MEPGNMNFSPELCYDGVQYRSSNTELKEVKQMLLSGNKDEITVAVGRVLSEINHRESAIEMITCDIPEFLCDAMLPLDPYVSGTIYTCLGIMAEYEHFFIHNHSSFAMETIIRALHFIIKSGGHDVTISQPINVIVLIVQGYVNFDILPEKKPFENLMNLLLGLLKRKTVSQEVAYKGGFIIKLLFELEIWKLSCSHSLIEICGRWFDLTSPTLETFQSLPKEMTNLGCSLSEHTLRHLTQDDGINSQTSSDNETDWESRIINTIIIFLVDLVAPEIVNLVPPNNEKHKMETLANFFTSITYIFNELYSQKSHICHRLSEMGFIHLIKNILSYRECEKLGKTCVTVVTEILLTLSDDVFNFPDMWPMGRDHFRKELTVGMSLLPLDSSKWLYKFSDVDLNRSSRLALIIYFYFYCLTANSNSSMEHLHPFVVKLMNLPVGINSAALIVKSIWFIFVLSHMSNTSESPGSSNWGNKKMLEILEFQKEFSSIYTHHPSVLYWAFSSSTVNCKMQCEVVKLWLRNRSPDCTILDELMKQSEDVRFAVFQLLQDGYHDQVAHLAFSTLKTFMLQSNDDILSSNVWFLLPQFLAKYTTDTSNAVKVDYVVELASLRVPHQPDISKLVRISTLLPEAAQKSDLISSSSVFSLSLQLLEISMTYEDYRVLFAFLRCGNFIRRIVNGITTNFAEIASTCLRIVTILWNVKLEWDRLPSYYKKLSLDAYGFLKILDVNDVKPGLILLEQMLTSEFQSVLFVIQRVTIEFRRTLLYKLENILLKNPPIISAPAWKCMQHCLKQETSLINDCFLHEVVKHALHYIKDTPEMVDFLMVWMDKKIEQEKFFDGSRQISKSYFLETLEKIAAFLADNIIDDWNSLSQKVLKCCKHFSVDTRREPFHRIL